MDLEDEAKASAAKAEGAMAKLKSVLDVFRGTIKNDLTSIKAASDRVQTEVLSMNKHYQETSALLTSPEFTAGVQNAERLATALEAIHRLQGQRIGFAMFTTDDERDAAVVRVAMEQSAALSRTPPLRAPSFDHSQSGDAATF